MLCIVVLQPFQKLGLRAHYGWRPGGIATPVLEHFRTIFGPFSTVFGPFCTVRIVFFRFFASWRHGGAAAPSRRRHGRMAPPQRQPQSPPAIDSGSAEGKDNANAMMGMMGSPSATRGGRSEGDFAVPTPQRRDDAAPTPRWRCSAVAAPRR